MSLRSRLTALIFGACATTSADRRPIGTQGRRPIGTHVPPARQAALAEASRQELDDFWARSTHVERDGHFDAPKIVS